MSPRQEPTKREAEEILGWPRSERISELARPGRPAYRDLISGLTDQAKESLGHVLGLI
jgi:hypothetical protein